VFNNAAWKVIMNAFKHAHSISVATYYTLVLKHQMKPTQVKGIYLTKVRHLQGTVDWLVKDSKAVDISYAYPQAHGIANVALHREYSPGIVFIFSQGRKDIYHV
jgi:hypothetical protein